MNTIHEQVDMTTTYQARIGELNEIINDLSSKNSHLNKENEELKKELKNNPSKLLELIRMCSPRYPAYMVSNAILERFHVKVSSRYIVKIATENDFFKMDILALRIPRKKDCEDKNASTVVFSSHGIFKLIDILHEKFILNKNIEKDYLEISLKQYKEGKVKRYTMQELRDMEK